MTAGRNGGVGHSGLRTGLNRPEKPVGFPYVGCSRRVELCIEDSMACG